jgi:hypothetical protein
MNLNLIQRLGYLAATVAVVVLAAAPAFGQATQDPAVQQAEEAARLAAQACKPGPVTLPARLQGAPWT